MRFFRKKNNSEKIQSKPCVKHDSKLGGLSLQLNEHGQLLAMSDTLRSRLPESAATPGTHISAYLHRQAAWTCLPPTEWPDHLLLEFKNRQGSTLSLQGTTLQLAGNWYIVLYDASQTVPDDQPRHALQQALLNLSLDKANKLDTRSETLLMQISEEWLDGILLRLRIPWLLLSEHGIDGDRLREYARASLPGEQLPLAAINTLFNHHKETLNLSPVHLPVRLTGTALQLVLLPLSETGPTRFWLILPTPGQQDRAAYLNDRDWSAITSLFTTPLLYRLHQQRKARTERRSDHIETLLESGWWEYHPATARFTISRALAKTLELALDSRDSMAADVFLEAVAPLDRIDFQDRLTRAVQEHQKLDMPVRIQRGGQQTWYRMIAEQPTSHGPDTMLTGYAMNIEPQRELQSEAELARARLEKLVHEAPAIIYTLNYSNGMFDFDFCSSSIRPILGWNTEQIRNTAIGELVHPDDRTDYYASLRTLLATGSITRRYRIRNTVGAYRWVLDESRLLCDQQGLPREATGLLIDITEAVEAAQQAKESEERYRILVEDSPAIICRYLPDLTITYGNKQFYHSLGLDPDTERPVRLTDYLAEKDRNILLERYAGITPNTHRSTQELTLKVSENTYVCWILSDHALFNQTGRLTEIQSVARDITEVNNAQQQLNQSSKMAALGEIATSLVHEISQPLTVMNMTLANILKKIDTGQADHEYIGKKLFRLQGQIHRATRIIDHMREFGRASDPERSSFNPLEGVENALLLVRESMHKKQIAIQVSQEVYGTPIIKGHFDRFEQVLLNLLLNAQYAAIKNAVQRPPEITLHTSVEGSEFLIRIIDSGCGIPADLAQRLFEPFVTTKPVGEGTGLGLSVSQRIIQSMGGQLTATNIEDAGACFSIRLPLSSDTGPS